MSSPPPADGPFFRAVDWLAFATTLVITLAAYTYTLAPTVTLEDSGELVVAADYLGVPHPPGYPIWTLLAWFFQWVFHGVTFRGHPNPAWAVGFMSAVFGALACALTSLLVSRSGYDMLQQSKGVSRVLGSRTERLLSWVGGVAGGLLFAFSSVLWSQSVIVEVYSLNAFFLALILVLTYRWMCRPHESLLLYVVAFLFGLGLTNHQSLMFALPGLVCAILFRDLRLFRDCITGGLWLLTLLLFYRTANLGAEGPASASAASAGARFTLGAAMILAGWAAQAWNDDPKRALLRPPEDWLIRGGGGVALWVAACFCAYRFGLAEKGEAARVFFFLVGAGAAAGAVYVVHDRLMTQWQRFVFMVALVIVGLAFYLYLPIASDQNPPMNWGYPRTEEGFWHAIGRGQYERISPIDNAMHAIANPSYYLSLIYIIVFQPGGFTSVVSQFTGWMLPFVAATFVFLLAWAWRVIAELVQGRLHRDQWQTMSWLLVTLVSFFLMTVVFVLFQYPDLDVQTLFIGRVQYIQAHGIYALWISYGLVLTLAFLDSRVPGSRVVRFGGIALAFLLPLILISRNAFDREYLELAGCVEQNGHDFGWQFGHYQLQGMEAILDELEADEPPPPRPDFPPPMEPNAIFFGGTDPGRFVPTYMIYSAKVRPDIYLITQNALADNTYMSVMRDLYGDEIWIPSVADSNQAFAEYVNDVKAGRIPAGAEVTEQGGRVSVQGVQGVMMINGILSKQIFDANRHRHAFYVEESYVIPWMYPYLTPHGLIMKINRDPLPQIPDEIVTADREFWTWYADRLLRSRKFQRDVVARKTFSKLRSSIGGLYVYRQRYAEAEFAFQQAVALYDLSPEANFRLADAYTKQAKFAEAIQVITTFLDKDPGNDKVRAYLGQLQLTDQRYRRRAELEPILAKGATLDVAMELLEIYRDLGQGGQFENLAREMLSKPQLPAPICRQIGDLSMSFRRFGMAIEAYQGVTQRTPDNYAGWIDLAAAELAARKIQESVTTLARAVQLGGETARRDLRQDPRFEILQRSPAWKQLVPPPTPQPTLNLPFGGQ